MFSLIAPEIVVDCDPGIDDALALLAVAALVEQRRLAVRAVTVVQGNAPIDVTSRNAAYVLSRSALRGAPVLRGPGSGPVAGPPADHGPSLHGSDGLGGLAPAAGVRSGRPAEGGAVDTLRRWLGHRGVTVALGPLTNVALALDGLGEQHPEATEIIVMGGCSDAAVNRLDNGAEFNFASDPWGAATVLDSPLPVTVVPLDVTERVAFTARDVELVTRAPSSPLVGDLLAANLTMHREVLGIDRCYVHDAVALTALTDPQLMATEEAALSVVRDGPGAGRLERRPGTGGGHRIVTDCDADGVRRRLVELWSRSELHAGW